MAAGPYVMPGGHPPSSFPLGLFYILISVTLLHADHTLLSTDPLTGREASPIFSHTRLNMEQAQGLFHLHTCQQLFLPDLKTFSSSCEAKSSTIPYFLLLSIIYFFFPPPSTPKYNIGFLNAMNDFNWGLMPAC